MKIELKIQDLETTLDGLNNAYIRLADLRNAIFLFGGLPGSENPKWEFLVSKNRDDVTEIIDKRLEAIKDLYEQLLNIEKHKEI